MKKHTVKRVLACALAAAVIFGSSKLPEAFAAAMQAIARTAGARTETLTEIPQSTLAAHASANSWHTETNNDGNGGPELAFDGNEATQWHSNYGTATDTNLAGQVTDNQPIWIQTGFGETRYVKKLTYKPRSNGNNIIGTWFLAVANLNDPTEEPIKSMSDANWSSQWTVVKSGGFGTGASVKTIELDRPVPATHIRLIARKKIGGGSTHVTASDIRIWAADSPDTSVLAPQMSVHAPVPNEAAQNAELEKVTPQSTLYSKDVTMTWPYKVTGGTTNLDSVSRTVAENNCSLRIVKEAGLDAFGGYYQLEHSEGQFDVGGSTSDHQHIPFALSFKMKLESALVNGKNYAVLGKMDQDYGIQLQYNDGKPCVCFYLKGAGGNWRDLKKPLPDDAVGRFVEVIAVYDGSQMWMSVDGNSFTKLNATDISIRNTEASKFTIGYNAEKDTDGTNVGNHAKLFPGLLADVEMYRFSANKTTNHPSNAVQLETFLNDELRANDPCLKIEMKLPYTDSTAWVWTEDGTEHTMTDGDMFEAGKIYTFKETLTAEEGYIFTDDSKPTSIHIGGEPVDLENGDVSISDDRTVMEITHTFPALGALKAVAEYADGCDAQMGTISASGSVNADETATFHAVAADGYEFAGWYTDAECTTSYETDWENETLEIANVQHDIKLYAKFRRHWYSITAGAFEETADATGAESTRGTVTITATGSTVDSGSHLVVGTQATLQAAPTAGNRFVAWKDGNGNLVTRETSFTTTSTTNHEALTYRAEFREAKAESSLKNVAKGTTPTQASITYPFGGGIKTSGGVIRPEQMTNGEHTSCDASHQSEFNANTCAQIDLGAQIDNIDHINLWRYWEGTRQYNGTVITISDTPDFANETVLYHADTTNIWSNNRQVTVNGQTITVNRNFGPATERLYPANAFPGTSTGKEVAVASGVSGRYVRIYMGRSDTNEFNHIIEFQVWAQITPVESIELDPAEKTLGKGETFDLTATVSPENATYQDVNWISENELVATVDANGHVTAVNGGTTTIKAVSKTDADIFASCTVTVSYNPNIQKEYWEKEQAMGTLGEQTADDVWHYQIKDNDAWRDTLATEFSATANNGAGGWLNGAGESNGFWWAHIQKTELTPCFKSSGTPYTGIAYAWKAQETGYARIKMQQPISSARIGGNGQNKDNIPLKMAHVSSDNPTADGEFLKEMELTAGETYEADVFTTKIVKVQPNDLLRISALYADNDVQNIDPYIELVTVREYAAQRLLEVGAMLADNEAMSAYTYASVEAAKKAKDALNALVTDDTSALDSIETKLAEMETAIENLEDYVAVTGVAITSEAPVILTLGDENALTAALTAALTPEDATDVTWTWTSDQEDIATVSSDGTVTAVGTGTATITVTVQNQNGGIGKPASASATCTVEVRRSAYFLKAYVIPGCENFGTVDVDKETAAYDEEATFTAQAREGYAFGGWYRDPSGDDLYLENTQAKHTIADVHNDVTLYAKFVSKKDFKHFVVTVMQDGDEKYHKDGSYNDAENVVHLSEATIKAPSDDMEFSHWEETKRPGIVFSTERNLTFRIPGNLELKPVYKRVGEEITLNAYAEVSDSYLIRDTANPNANAKVRFVGKLFIPKGWTLNETGLLWTGKDTDTIRPNEFVLNDDGSAKLGTKKIEAPKINTSYQFSATISNVPLGKTVRGKIYAKITNDETGVTQWVYSLQETAVTHTEIETD